MRYSQEHKQETYEKIVQVASRQFRQKGFDGVSIGDLMAELTLTHGGFYRHFSNKEHLYTAALAFGIGDVQARLTGRSTDGAIPTLAQVIEAYLSIEHCEGIADGCPVAALSAEIARQSIGTRDAFDGALYAYMEALLPLLNGETETDRRRQFLILFSGMAGALSVARAVADVALRRSILESARQFYIRTFCE